MEEFTRMPVHRVAEIVATTNEVGMPGLCASGAVLRMLACIVGLLQSSRAGGALAGSAACAGEKSSTHNGAWAACYSTVPWIPVPAATTVPLLRSQRNCLSISLPAFLSIVLCSTRRTVPWSSSTGSSAKATSLQTCPAIWSCCGGCAAATAADQSEQRRRRRQQQRQLNSRFSCGRGQLSCCGACTVATEALRS